MDSSMIDILMYTELESCSGKLKKIFQLFQAAQTKKYKPKKKPSSLFPFSNLSRKNCKINELAYCFDDLIFFVFTVKTEDFSFQDNYLVALDLNHKLVTGS